jgi:8-oxo-dGTP diphosphatase
MVEIKDKEMHRISVTAIIYKKDPNPTDGQVGVFKYLITRRSLKKKAFPGQWVVPGGGLEVDDYIDTPKNSGGLWYNAVTNSLKREVMEEVNLKVGKLDFLCDITFIRSDGIPVIILSYYGPYESGDVKLDEDNTEFAWVTAEEAKEYDLIDGVLGEIEEVEEILT